MNTNNHFLVDLLAEWGNELTFETDAAIAAARLCGPRIVQALLEYEWNDEEEMREILFEAAASNRERWGTDEVVRVFLEQPWWNISRITNGVLTEAASNPDNGKQIMETLFGILGDGLKISEEMLMAAAGLDGREMRKNMGLLLRRGAHQVRITKRVVEALEGYREHEFDTKLRFLLKYRLEITKDGVAEIAKYADRGTFELLQLHRNYEMTEGVVISAALNEVEGDKIMEMMLHQEGSNRLRVTERVCEAATQNHRLGADILTLLMRERPDEVPLTQNLIGLAVDQYREYRSSYRAMMEALFGGSGPAMKIVEIMLEHVAGVDTYNVDDIMVILTGRRGYEISLSTWEVLEALKDWPEDRMGGTEVLNKLLDPGHGKQEMQIPQEFLRAAAACWGSTSLMKRFLKSVGDSFHINEDMMLAAATDKLCGQEMMEVFFRERNTEVKLTDEIIAISTQNPRCWHTLFKNRKDEVQITEDVMVAMVEGGSGDMIRDLLEHGASVTNRVVEAAAASRQWLSYKAHALLILLEEGPDDVRITPKVVELLAANCVVGDCMEILMGHKPHDVKITPKMVAAAVGNNDEESSSPRVLQALVDVGGVESFQMTEELLILAAERRIAGGSFMRYMLETWPDAQVTEQVVLAAAGNEEYDDWEVSVMKVLLQQRPEDVVITDELLKTAARNRGCGGELMFQLLRHKWTQIRVTDELLRAAVENKEEGKKVLKVLMNHGGDRAGDGVVRVRRALEEMGEEV